jgi:hypothetical protein
MKREGYPTESQQRAMLYRYVKTKLDRAVYRGDYAAELQARQDIRLFWQCAHPLKSWSKGVADAAT